MLSASRFVPSCLAAFALLTGCFTETGNPDDEAFSLSARFAVDYDPSALHKLAASDAPVAAITRLTIAAWKADFETDQGSVNLWAGLPQRWVDFPKGDTLLWLPDSFLFQGAWRIFHFNFGIPAAKPVVADTLDYEAFEDTSYMKGVLGSPSLPFLFEMPQVRRLALIYHDSTLEKLRTPRGLKLTVAFRAEALFRGVDPGKIQVSHDRKGRPFLLLNQGESSGCWPRLKDNFFRAFEADSTEVEKTPLPPL